MGKHAYWKNDDIIFLQENFPFFENDILSEKMGKSKWSIILKAHRLKLKKNPQHKSLMVSRRNKIVGRDLSVNFLIDVAKKYKTKSEFQLRDASAYSAARKLGLLNKLCSHMVVQSFSVPQLILQEIIEGLITTETLYNNRTIIYPYEIDIFLPKFKAAFEYNGKKWHLNNLNDAKKANLCLKKDIPLFIFEETSRNYIDDIKIQFIEKLDKINMACNTQITQDDVNNFQVSNVYTKIYNIDDLVQVSKKYTTFKEFKEKEMKVYRKLIKLKLIDYATSHMKDRRKERNITEVTERISTFTHLSDLIKYDFGTYSYVKKNKLNYLLINLKRKRGRF